MHDHDTYDGKVAEQLQCRKKVVLLGNPNVGKSVIFGLLTGTYVTVSNYPGTSVEITKGTSAFDKHKTLIIDTPGINSLIPQSEDERVARDIILKETFKNLIQVADAKNLNRALFISLQLAECGVPFVLDLNMDDEARSRGIRIDKEKLSEILDVEVISTIATQKKGIKELIKSIDTKRISQVTVEYDKTIEEALKKLIPLLIDMPISRRFLGVMLLAGDASLIDYIATLISEKKLKTIQNIIQSVTSAYSKPVSEMINQKRYKKVNEILARVLTKDEVKAKNISAFIGNLCMHPVWGVPIVAGVLYLVYKIVGEFAAGTCVDFLEGVVFKAYVNPLMIHLFNFVPVEIIRELFVGEYGIITMALTYAIAIVLPIVGFFFIIFGLLEDSGYLPRLAVMVNKIFKAVGLNGKAVLPMVLGLGCGTMAVMTARILPTKKERIIVTLLLALAVPCSAQLGVIFGETSTISVKATLIWALTLTGITLIIGYAASIIIHGKSSDFAMEIPPMRVPRLSNIVIKTYARIEWYLKEAVPLFILGTVILFVLAKTGLLNVIENAAAPLVVNMLHLPKEAAGAFVMGFLRRDYAAVLIVRGGGMDPIQMLVGIMTITLFVPCIAQMFIMVKERGLKTALAIIFFVFGFAFIGGGAFNFVLRYFNVTF